MSALPDLLRSTLSRLSEGRSRRDLAERARAMSAAYREGGTSVGIADERDALAYALSRMPATYAAVAACLQDVREARPSFAPVTLIDAGAGPGTATWAAAQALPSLSDFVLLDANPALAALGRTLADADPRLSSAGYRTGEIRQLLANAPAADLIVASYMFGELPDEARGTVAALMWEQTRDILLVVEPGTPDGYRRIIVLRAQLVALGAHVVAPCPHDAPCPLAAGDWCHFAQRLPRSRDHMHLKDADVPFEDEKFSYVALSRLPSIAHAARVLSPPRVGKAAIDAAVCAPGGIVEISVPRRDKAAYAAARRWRWGDAVPPP